MKLARFEVRALLVWALFLAPLEVEAQTLSLTNGIQTYTALTNTTVTMTGRCELHLTTTNNPIPGCVINLNSPDAWLFLPGIGPSSVSANYLSQVLVNGAAAAAGSNCRLDQYLMGSVIIPQSPSYTPLQIFGGPNFVGPSAQLGLYSYYTNTVLGGLDRNIGSFRLKRGYMATFAQNTDGTGASQVFVAQDADLDVGQLAASLNRPISFVRVFPWRWTGKKGWGGGDGASTITEPLWWYDWGSGASSTPDREYIPMMWSGSSGTSGINSKQGSTQVLGFNEPDQTNQANMTVAQAIAAWPALMRSGLRVGAPAVSDSGLAGQGPNWLYSFMAQATNLGYRVDYVPIHWYKCGQSASQLYNYLATVYQKTGRPIWLTEFNNGANWCQGSISDTAEATAVSNLVTMLEGAPFVERYAIYQWFDTSTGLRMVTTNSPGTLTLAGQYYEAQPSAMAYAQTLPSEGSRGIAQFEFETNTLDSSGYGNNGFAVGIPSYTEGHTGQAVGLDGTNSYIQLSPSLAQTNAFSFAAWVYWNGGPNWQRIFDFGNDTSHYLFFTPSSGSGTLRFAINNGGGEQIVETAPLPIGQWQHVAVTLTNGSAMVYTNGVLAASSGSVTLVPSNFTPTRNYLGKSQFPADPLFSGSLDEVQIADYVFTPAQVASLLTNLPPQFATNLLDRGTATPLMAFSTNVTGTAADPDPGDSVTYSKAGGPAWLAVNPDGTLAGTPGSGDGGTNYFTVRATDTAGESSFAVVRVVVPITYASGIWTNDADGSWGDAFNWNNGVIANGGNGGNYTADFSTITISADRTVALDQSRTIGTLKFGELSGAQNWTLTFSGGNALTLDTGSSTVPSIVVSQNTANIAVPLGGVNGFSKSGAGILVLSNANTLSGTVNIDTSSTTTYEGVVRAASPGAFGSVTNIQIRDNNSGSSTLQLDGSAGNLTVSAALTVNCRNTSVATIQNLAGTNTFSGKTFLNVGGNMFNIESDAGLLLFTGTSQYVGSLTGGRNYVFSGSGDHLVNGAILNSTNGAPIGLIKSGTGTLTLGGANTYTNTTTVSGGALLVNGSIGLSPVTVASSATLGGGGVIQGSVTIQAGATLAPGSNSIGALTINKPLTNSGTVFLRLSKSGLALTNSTIKGVNVFSMGGVLAVTNIGPDTITVGDSFKLFYATNFIGNFGSIVPATPGSGLAWDTNSLAGNGILAVALGNVSPAFAQAALEGTNLVLNGSGGAAGYGYSLLSSTDIALPLTNWSVVGTGLCDADGNFAVTNPVTSSFPQLFYRVRIP
jgi:autotransporter-associated beta strand protein